MTVPPGHSTIFGLHCRRFSSLEAGLIPSIKISAAPSILVLLICFPEGLKGSMPAPSFELT